MPSAAGFGSRFLKQPLPVRIAGLTLGVWFVMLCLLPDPRPLAAPEWTVRLAQRLAGIAEPRARFVATLLLRGAGVGLIGVLLAIALSRWRSRAAVPTLLVAAPLLALVAKWINFGALPIWPQLVFILLVAFVGGLAGLTLRRNWAALGTLVLLTGGLAAWAASTGVCDDLYEAWQGTARHVLDAAADVPDGDEGFLRLLEITFAYAEDNSHGTDAVLSDESRSLAVGLSKEAMDSTPGGSGFSFVDMAANSAGIRLAAAATRTSRAAHAIQARIRRGVEVSDLLPSLRELPEGITRDRLQTDYGGLGGAETRRLLGEIDRRIAELPLYRGQSRDGGTKQPASPVTVSQ